MGKALMVRIGIVLVALGIVLGACTTRPVDTFCLTHTADEFLPTVAEIQVMTPARKRDVLEILREGQAKCGWRPA